MDEEPLIIIKDNQIKDILPLYDSKSCFKFLGSVSRSKMVLVYENYNSGLRSLYFSRSLRQFVLVFEKSQKATLLVSNNDIFQELLQLPDNIIKGSIEKYNLVNLYDLS